MTQFQSVRLHNFYSNPNCIWSNTTVPDQLSLSW